MIVKINNEIVATEKGSISISKATGERSTCSFTVVDIEGTARYDKGMNVFIEVDGNREFGGVVETSTETRIVGLGLYHNIQCVDWHYLADKRIIAKRYENIKTGEIVKDIVDSYLSFEGVGYNTEDTSVGTTNVNFTSNSDISVTNNVLNLITKSNTENVNLLPTMTSNTTPSPYEVTYSSNPMKTTTPVSDFTSSRTLAYTSFDNKSNTGSGSLSLPFSVMINLRAENAVEFTKYSIVNKNRDNNDLWKKPTAWKIWAVEAGKSVFELMDTRTNQNFDFGEEKFYNVSNTNKKYQCFILEITDSVPVGTETVGFTDIGEFKIIKTIESILPLNSSVSSYANLNGFSNTQDISIDWKEVKPNNTDIKVEISIDNGINWNTVVNGYSLSSLFSIEQLVSDNPLVKVNMSTLDSRFTPTISDIKFNHYSERGTLQEGVSLDEAVFNYIPISEALESLAEKTGFWWDIDANKQLHFAEKSTRKAPFEINTMTITRDSLSVENGNSQYRNHQYLIGGKDITDVQTENFTGDGTTQTFTVGYKLAKVPLVYLNGRQISVGIRGLDDDGENPKHQWFWSKGENTITQLKTATPLEFYDYIRIDYQGEFEVVVLSRNMDEVRNTKLLENKQGTGIVEWVDEDRGLSSRESAFQSATQKINQYGKRGRKIKFSTWKKGLDVGQMITVDFPIHGIEKTDFLIDTINITYVNNVTEYSIVASYNVSEGSWAKFFYKLATQGRSYVIRENIGDGEILIMLEIFEKTWNINDDPNIFYELYPSTKTFPTETTFPVFDIHNAMRYLVLFNDNTEVFRKAVTKTTVSDDNREIISTVNILPNEANSLIFNSVGWYGGSEAGTNKGTGFLLDKQPFRYDKNSEISLQIDKIDTKGW